MTKEQADESAVRFVKALAQAFSNEEEDK